MTYDVHRAVRDACLWLPETEEFLSHGSPNFRVRGKTFATYVVNHHGDGRVALWLNVAPGLQQAYVEADPRRYFVPAYVGSRGWVGVRLDQGLAWRHIVARVRESYEKVAPGELRAAVGKVPAIRAPPKLAPSDIDPLRSARGKSLLQTVRGICGHLPETHEGVQFGYPVWQAGTKTFLWARAVEQALTLCFWVGVEQQNLLTADERFRIPAYMGHNGWISLDVTAHCDADEVAALAAQSYRHFALRRMLARLDSSSA